MVAKPRVVMMTTPERPNASWWMQPMSREEFQAAADARARDLAAVTTTQHIQRKENEQ